MDILITSKTQKIPGPSVQINCPACHADNVQAESLKQVDQLGLFYIIPLFRLTNTFVTCTACRREMMSAVSIDEIENISPLDLSSHLSVRVSFVSKAVAVLSILLFFMPIVGLILGVLSILLNLRTVGWPKTLSYVSTVLAAIVTFGLMILLALNK